MAENDSMSCRPAGCTRSKRFHAPASRSCSRSFIWLSLAGSIALILQGCETRKACKIDNIYQLIQVDGRTGLAKAQLEKVGIKLCARHLKKAETYENDACMEPEDVFPGGELPTTSNGDVNALLLVRCPNSAYPKGKELQRVTCSEDFMGEDEDGEIEKALHIRFDNYERASNCLLGENVSISDLLNDDSSLGKQQEPMTKDVEFFKAVDRAAEESQSRVAVSMGPAILGRKATHSHSEVAEALRDVGVSIHPHGMLSMQSSGQPHGHHVHHRQRGKGEGEDEEKSLIQDAKSGIMRSAPLK